MKRIFLILTVACLTLFTSHRSSPPALAESSLFGFSGWVTYYGIEDGFVRGDVMFDGTSYDPADPTITAASFLIPLHTWLRVCSPSRCIMVQVRDRGLLDQNSVLLDLSRSAYALLFGGLGGKQWVSAYFSDPSSLTMQPAPLGPNSGQTRPQ